MVKEPQYTSRRQVADLLGISYSLLRVYERALGDLLMLKKGPNRATLYLERSLTLLREAVHLHQDKKIPFSLLREFLTLPEWETTSTDSEVHPKGLGWEPFGVVPKYDGYSIYWRRKKA